MDRPRRSDGTAGQMDGEAGWWTTSGNIGLHPLARVMGVDRQQHYYDDSDTLIMDLSDIRHKLYDSEEENETILE